MKERFKGKQAIKIIAWVALCVLLLAIGYRGYEEYIYMKGSEEAENGKYEEAKAEFEKIPLFKDSKEQVGKMEKKIDEVEERKKEEEKLENQYEQAVKDYNAGNYSKAKEQFGKLGNYLDSKKYYSKCEEQINRPREDAYKLADKKFREGNYSEALVGFEVLGDYKDSISRVKECRNMVRLELSHTIYAGIRYSLLISENSKVVIEGDAGNIKVDELGDAVSVAGKGAFALGLSRDGKVSMSGKDEIYNFDVADWEEYEILAIDAGQHYAVALTSEHRVVHQGRNDEEQKECEKWKNIRIISSGARHIAGIDFSGNVHIAGYQAKEQQRQIDANKDQWNNVTAIAAGGGVNADSFTVGLKKDGTLVFAGNGQNYKNIMYDVNRNEDRWKDLKAVAAGNKHIVGITKDNRVITAGDDSTITYLSQLKEEKIPNWENVIAVSAGDGLTLGLQKNHHVYAAGKEYQGQLRARNWTDVLIRPEWPWLKDSDK